MNTPVVKILVCCHKPGEWLSDDVYMPIQCGKAISQYDLGIQGDDTGDNISAKNPYYCELTALYWAWKNLKNVDYIGLCHYRRYFDFKKCGATMFYNLQSINYNHLKFSSRYLDNYDVILPSSSRHACSVQQVFASATVISYDIYILYKIIEKYCPDYLPTLKKYLLSNKKYSCNMFVMKKSLFNEYCMWAFDILFKMECSIKISPYISYKRIFGYIGEILLPVYCMHNHFRIKERQIIFCKDSFSLKRKLKLYHIRYFFNNLSFAFANLFIKRSLYNEYWESYLQVDKIKI